MGAAPAPGIDPTRGRSVPWQARMLLLASIWGSSFLFIKVGDEVLAPIQVALARTLLGALTVLILLVVRRQPMPRGRTLWMHLAIAGLLFNTLPFIFFAYGETRTTSVLAGIWNATTALFTLVITMMFLADERPTRERTTGLLLGFGGVLVVLGVWRGLGGREMTGNLLCMGASVSYGFGFTHTRRFLSRRSESAVTLISGQLLCATVQLAVITPFVSSVPHSLPLKVMLAMLAIGVLGTGFGYILNYGLIQDAGPTLASTVTYVVPLFSTVEGMIFLGEPLTWYEPVGALVVILGVAIAQERVRLPTRRPLSHSP